MKKEKEIGIIKLLVFVYKKYYHKTRFAWQIFAYIILRFLTNLYPLLISFLLARVIDISIVAVNEGKEFSEVVPTIILFAIAVSVWTVVNNLFQYLDSTIDLWVSYLDDEVYLNKYIQIEPKAYEDPRFINQKENLNWNGYHILHSFFEFLEAISLTPVLIISFLAIYSQIPFLAVLAVVSTIPSALIIKKFGKKMWGIWSDKGEEKIKYSSYRSVLWGSNFEQLQEVYVFKYGKYLLDKAKKINKEFIERFKRNYVSRYSWSTIATFASNIVNIFVLIYSIRLVFSGELTIGMLTFIISAYQKFNGDTSDILYKISSVLGNKKILSTFYNVLNWKNSINNGEEELQNIATGLSVEFKNVWFRYPKTKKWILRGVNFRVNEDEDIAIVGKNGAGKSTIIKLLLRIYDPQRGNIFVNGNNIKDLDLDSYYKLVGILSQSFNKLSITVEDNILVGDVNRKNGKDVREAGKLADIHDTVMALPFGYKTFLSREIKDGVQLSGGQWQKLAIARAFFRKSKLLILDEPTSAVDSISEEKIFESIRENAKNTTTIIVSHRFATVRKAKRIIVIDEGSIIEDGNHEKLIKRNGLYSEMYNKQVG